MRHFLNTLLGCMALPLLIGSCSSAGKSDNSVIQKSDVTGSWTVTDISADVPAGYRINNVFDEAPYQDFQSSTWTFDRNGYGNFTLKNGKKQNIYWSLYKTDSLRMLQFKKIEEGEKPRNIEDGYRMEIQQQLNNSFILQLPVPVNNTNPGHLRFTFRKTGS